MASMPRQSSRERFVGDFLTRHVGLLASVAEGYMPALVKQGYDTEEIFLGLSAEELSKDFEWEQGHIKRFEAWKQEYAKRFDTLRERGVASSSQGGGGAQGVECDILESACRSRLRNAADAAGGDVVQLRAELQRVTDAFEQIEKRVAEMEKQTPRASQQEERIQVAPEPEPEPQTEEGTPPAFENAGEQLRERCKSASKLSKAHGDPPQSLARLRSVSQLVYVHRLGYILEKEPEVVTVTMQVPLLDSARYHGQELEVDTKLDGSTMTNVTRRTLKFRPRPGGVLCIAGAARRDSTHHGMLIRCESTDPDSAWNFAVTPQNAGLFVRARGMREGDPEPEPCEEENEARVAKWQMQDFDDSDPKEWRVPTARGPDGWHGTHVSVPGAKAVWWDGPESRVLFRLKGDHYKLQNQPLQTAITKCEALEKLRQVIRENPDEFNDVRKHYPWLEALPVGSTEIVSGQLLQNAVASRAHQTVLRHLLGAAKEGAIQVGAAEKGAIQDREEDSGATLLYLATKNNLELASIRAILTEWPGAAREEGLLGRPLSVASRMRLPFESQSVLLVASASFGELSLDEILDAGSCGCLRRFAQAMETHEGVKRFHSLLLSVPNVIMCCLSIAQAMQKHVPMEPSRATLLKKAAKGLVDLATELALSLDRKISSIEARKDSKELVEALLQPDSRDSLRLMVSLHAIETVSVPWIFDLVQAMEGDSLRFMTETWSERGGKEQKFWVPNGRPLSVEEAIDSVGALWPLKLVTFAWFLSAASNNPLLLFQSATARYWFDTGIYVAFVLAFSFALLRGPDTSGLGPFVTVWAWLWVVAALLQELGEAWYSKRQHFNKDFWNVLELLSPLLVGSGLVFNEVLNKPVVARQVNSFAVLTLWLRLLEVFERFASVGPLVAVIGRMMRLLIQFAVLCTVFVAAWSVGMFALLRDTHELYDEETWTKDYHSLQVTTMTMLRVFVGDFEYGFLGAENEESASFMYALYLLLIIVLVLNLLIAVLSAEHSEVYEDMDKEYAFTRTRTTLRMWERVDSNKLPAPLNLLQLPCILWNGLTRRNWRSGGQHVAWLCWLVIVMPVVGGLLAVVGTLFYFALAVQITELPTIKRGDRWPLPVFNKLNPQGRWFKPLMGVCCVICGLVSFLLSGAFLSFYIAGWILQVLIHPILPRDLLTFEPSSNSMEPQKAHDVTKKYWSNREWDALLGSIVSDICAVAEEGTSNPLHLNAPNRSLWLCERAMRSEKRIAELAKRQEEIAETTAKQQKEIALKLDDLMKKKD